MASHHHNTRDRGGRSGRGRRSKGNWRDSQKRTDRGSKESQQEGDDNSPVVKAFKIFQEELDNRNDRHERIFKLSRDITIESKRLIFLLQRVIGSEEPDKLLAEAAEKIKELNATKFQEIAKELEGQDSYQFLRAYTGGLQEYIEAVTFYHYLTQQHLVNLEKIQNELIFKETKPPSTATSVSETVKDNVSHSGKADSEQDAGSIIDNVDKDISSVAVTDQTKESVQVDCTTEPEQPSLESSQCQDESKVISVHIPPSEYMLGVADFTGELMRMAINSVGAGDLETPRVVANMMRVIHNAFSVFDNASRELRKKASVLRQSLQKVETACYTLTVRGSEIPQHMLTDVFTSASISVDSYNIDDNGEELYD